MVRIKERIKKTMVATTLDNMNILSGTLTYWNYIDIYIVFSRKLI